MSTEEARREINKKKNREGKETSRDEVVYYLPLLRGKEGGRFKGQWSSRGIGRKKESSEKKGE